MNPIESFRELFFIVAEQSLPIRLAYGMTDAYINADSRRYFKYLNRAKSVLTDRELLEFNLKRKFYRKAVTTKLTHERINFTAYIRTQKTEKLPVFDGLEYPIHR